MRVSYILVATSLFTFIFLSSCNNVFALEKNIGKAQIDPVHPLYFLKALREDLEIKFAGTDRIKFLRYVEFSTRRLREAKALAGGENEDFILSTMEKYWDSLNFALSVNSGDSVLGHALVVHMAELQKLNKEIKSSQVKLAVLSVINKLAKDPRVGSDVKISGCKFLLSESSSSAFTTPQRVILGERAEDCLKMF